MVRLNLLVVEDDPVIGKSLKQGLTEAGHDCALAKTGDEGLSEAGSQQYDALILDILLPGKSGLQVLEELRQRGIRTPTILLTALGSVEERVAGLKAGADDYLVKPFALPELLARLEAVCRRASSRPAPVLEAGILKLDLTNRRVTAGAKEVDLSPTEFSLLEMLMRHAGQVVTRKMLCEHLWKSDWEGATNVIEVHVNRLRNKLDKLTSEPLIDTVRGRGYAVRAN
ncbi:MAG: response regulator transcription factor [Planctomycetaceae bacterium]|nr:response regulator transcription factor [Planctomycetaceae bacterium]